MKIQDLLDAMRSLSPEETAADWDNVGLLTGSAESDLSGVLTCLTLTSDVAAEAIASGCNAIVTHHPLMLKGVRSLTDLTYEGRTLRLLMKHDINVYCPHTAFDNCAGGINDQLAAILGVQLARPLRTRSVRGASLSEGRIGCLKSPDTLEGLAERLKTGLSQAHIQAIRSIHRPIDKIAIVCGAGGEFLNVAIDQGAQLFVTGEMRFHDCIAAQESGIDVLLPGHFATEHIGADFLANFLNRRLSDKIAKVAQCERDPLSVL